MMVLFVDWVNCVVAGFTSDLADTSFTAGCAATFIDGNRVPVIAMRFADKALRITSWAKVDGDPVKHDDGPYVIADLIRSEK